MTDGPKITELDGLRALPVPRPGEVCDKFARRIEPLVGFIVYGVVWLFLITNTTLLAGLFAGGEIGELVGSTSVAAVVGVALAIALAGGSIWLYLVWFRRKRAHAARLVRDGELVDGKIVDKASDRAAQIAARIAFAAAGAHLGASWYRVEFARGGARYHVLCPFHRAPEPAATAPVLFVPDYKYALGFDPHGRAYVCRVHRDAG